MKNKIRVAAIIIKDGQILLMHRIRSGEDYYVFPGGGMEEGENLEEALKREMKEELGLDFASQEVAFELDNEGNKEVYFLIKKFSGEVKLGGPEKERVNADNQYYPEWVNLLKAASLKNLFPREAVIRMRRLPDTNPNPEYYKAIPKKWLASSLLIFNAKNELLIVKQSYKDYWTIPGGLVDENESPREAAIREAKEEVGIEPTECQLLCLDYVKYEHNKEGSLQFVFYGGVVSADQVKIDRDEIEDCKFVKVDEAPTLLTKKFEKRLLKSFKALKENRIYYLESRE